jgi:hypothetical protein
MRFRVIHVVNAVISRQKEKLKMITTTTIETGAFPAIAAGETPKPNKTARVGARRAPVAPGKAKAGKKATLATKAPKSAKKAKTSKPEARDGSKTARILELLKRPGGVTAKELMKATSWLPHSVRGFLSGTVGKKMKLTVTSVKGEDGERSYSVKA